MFSGLLAHAWLRLLYSSGPAAQGTVLPTVDWALLCQLVIKRYVCRSVCSETFLGQVTRLCQVDSQS